MEKVTSRWEKEGSHHHSGKEHHDREKMSNSDITTGD